MSTTTQKVKEKIDYMADKAKETAEKVGKAIHDAAANAGTKIKEAGDKIKDTGDKLKKS